MHSSVRTNAALFCGQLGLGLLQTSFNFYYVKVFLNVNHVTESWFRISQLLFLLWNAINDPIFGYLQVSFVQSCSYAELCF